MWEQLLSRNAKTTYVFCLNHARTLMSKGYAGMPRAPSLLLFAIGAIRQGNLAWGQRQWTVRGQKTTNVTASVGKQYETYYMKPCISRSYISMHKISLEHTFDWLWTQDQHKNNNEQLMICIRTYIMINA